MQKISTNQKPGLAAKKLSRFSSHPLLAKRKAVRISDDHFSNSYLFMAPKFQNADLVFSFFTNLRHVKSRFRREIVTAAAMATAARNNRVNSR